MYTFQLIIRFGDLKENERKRYGAAGQMLALGVSTTPKWKNMEIDERNRQSAQA